LIGHVHLTKVVLFALTLCLALFKKVGQLTVLTITELNWI
jgi:hypothetical protein